MDVMVQVRSSPSGRPILGELTSPLMAFALPQPFADFFNGS